MSQNNDKEIKDSLLDGFHEIVMTVDTIHYAFSPVLGSSYSCLAL